MWIATAEHSRSIDRRATEEFGIPSRVLMERAGLAVFSVVKEMLPPGGKLTVFCGRGNNGGDGFAVARFAADAGYHVECLVAADEDDLTADAAEQMRISRAQGVQPVFHGDARWQRRCECLGHRELIVDALLGTGARCEVKGAIREAIQAINRSGVPVVAVDVPSGICTDTGEELGESVWALRTVSFGLPKPFMFEGIGLEHSGFWSIHGIGFPNALLSEPTGARVLDREWVSNLIPERLKASHKGENGSVLVVAGSRRYRGAAVLAAMAALRAGAGLVTVASVPDVCDAVAAQLPEVILLPLPECDGAIAAEACPILLEQTPRHRSAVFGPGLAQTPTVHQFLNDLWQEWRLPCVIDADALNAVSAGAELPRADCVLTPHPGEMSRLLQCSVAEVQCDRFQTVRNACRKYEKTVVLKGAHTIVAEADEPILVNVTGNQGMAAAGMGDVLAGVIGTLLAQGLPPVFAAACGTYWHGEAGDYCADEIGLVGYTAGDVARALPMARTRIVERCH
jgi:NAD(P)H-hydrate epimerase